MNYQFFRASLCVRSASSYITRHCDQPQSDPPPVQPPRYSQSTVVPTLQGSILTGDNSRCWNTPRAANRRPRLHVRHGFMQLPALSSSSSSSSSSSPSSSSFSFSSSLPWEAPGPQDPGQVVLCLLRGPCWAPGGARHPC